MNNENIRDDWDDIFYTLVLKNNIFHSINDEVFKECGKNLTRYHMLFIDGIINLKILKDVLRIEFIEISENKFKMVRK